MVDALPLLRQEIAAHIADERDMTLVFGELTIKQFRRSTLPSRKSLCRYSKESHWPLVLV